MVKKKHRVNTTLQWRTIKCIWGREVGRNRLDALKVLLPLNTCWIWEKYMMWMVSQGGIVLESLCSALWRHGVFLWVEPGQAGRGSNCPLRFHVYIHLYIYIYICIWPKVLLGTGGVCRVALEHGNTEHLERPHTCWNQQREDDKKAEFLCALRAKF